MDIKNVFITGATGYIGGSVANLLLQKGYHVVGLVRKEADVETLSALGITAVRGTIHNASLMQEQALKADAVIHTADAADDPYPVDTFLDVLYGTGKTFIVTSGSAILGGKDNGEKSDFVYTEDIPLQPRFEMAHRVILNNHILRAAKKNVRSMVIVPPMVYGVGSGLKKESIQIPALVKVATQKGTGFYIEKGENIWSNVHIEDLASLYLDALEKGKPGSLYYAENGEASLKEIGNTISKKLGVEKTLSISIEEAVEIFGPAGAYFGFASNSRCNADKARITLGWQPKHTSIHDFI